MIGVSRYYYSVQEQETKIQTPNALIPPIRTAQKPDHPSPSKYIQTMADVNDDTLRKV
jgi:hypothetical protein